jgi:peptidoglycan/LPS O-acetylase OafA/YrhL
MVYRPEIDGLRAVAVLPVILFHAGLSTFSGGYVGVDVFFVISGFLITSILIQDLQEGRFSIIRFYERRARRILPALFFVMLCCLPFAYAWMPPDKLADFGKSIVAVCLFVSNILFWRQENYFAATAEEKPLLHTWSLAVEEQYYLLFPLVLFVLWRFGRNPVFYCVMALAVLSLLLNEWALRNPDITNTARFYLAPTRAWELLAGSICAFLVTGGPRRANDALALLGLAAIVIPVFAFDKTTPFPSLYTLFPVVGTALIILYAGSSTLVGRLLSTRGFVGIGLISYSAYLWHQPLFAFARLRSLTDPGLALMMSMGVLSLGLAWLSWRFVEQPFRAGRNALLADRRSLFSACLAFSVAFMALGGVMVVRDGLPGRLSADALAHLRPADPRGAFMQACQLQEGRPIPPHPLQMCSGFMADGAADVMIVGDSHAGALAYPLLQALQEAGLSGYSTAYPGCIGLPGFRRLDDPRYDCDSYMTSMLEYAERSGTGTIVIVSRLPLYFHETSFDNGEGGHEKGGPFLIDRLDAAGQAGLPDSRAQRVLDGYAAEILALAERFNVVLVRPIPVAGWDVPAYLAKREMFGGGMSPLSTDAAAFRAWAAPVTEVLDRLDSPGLRQVDSTSPFCDPAPGGRCLNERDGVALYSDDDHLSQAGAEMLVPRVMEQILSFQSAP